MSTPVKDVQIALKTYLDSIVLGGRSISTYQSELLKDKLSSLARSNYQLEFLALSPSTLITSINEDYRELIQDIAGLIEESNLLDIVSPESASITYSYAGQVLNETIAVFYTGGVSSVYSENIRKTQRALVLDKNKQILFIGLVVEHYEGYLYIETLKSNLVEHGTNIDSCTIDTWWGAYESISIWTPDSNRCFEDSTMNSWLHCLLKPRARTLYTTVWSLYYQSNPESLVYEVAKGIDNVQPGYAYLSITKKLFLPGVYTLKSKEVKLNNYYTNKLEFRWELSEPKNFLKRI